MWIKAWRTRVLLIFIQLLALAIALLIGIELEKKTLTSTPAADTWSQITNAQIRLEKTQASSQPSRTTPVTTTKTGSRFQPKYEVAWAHPTNYGERFATDINGIPVSNQPIVVLHETVYSATSALNFFQTPHPDETEQASYHTLIKLDGTIVYIIPPEKRAFGAANSVFDGPKGPETVKTHPKFPPSVNNFAYHAAFETPSDGRNGARRHSGYTDAQYRSLAWLVAQSRVPDRRIVTHRGVDRSGARIDPRSFNFKKFFSLLHTYRQSSKKKSQI